MTAEPNAEVAMVQRVLDKGMQGYTPDRIGLILRTVAPPGTTPDELALFLSFCEARDLNPLMKQVYLLKDKNGRVSIITGIDGLRLLAQRSGEYEGQVGPEWRATPQDAWDDVPPEDNLYAARVGVLRTGFKQPIWSVRKLSEFVKTDAWAVNWRDRPAHMLAIRAEADALKRAFPAETAGVTVHYEGGMQVEGASFSGDPDAPVTYPQLKPLHALAKEHGWDRAGRLAAASESLGREIKSFSSLTRGEASQLIDEWQDVPADPPSLRAGPDTPTPKAGETPSPSSPAGTNVGGGGNAATAVDGEDIAEPAATASPNRGGRSTRSGDPNHEPPPENAPTVGATASTSTHAFVGDGLLCEQCSAAAEHPDHRGGGK